MLYRAGSSCSSACCFGCMHSLLRRLAHAVVAASPQAPKARPGTTPIRPAPPTKFPAGRNAAAVTPMGRRDYVLQMRANRCVSLMPSTLQSAEAKLSRCGCVQRRKLLQTMFAANSHTKKTDHQCLVEPPLKYTCNQLVRERPCTRS